MLNLKWVTGGGYNSNTTSFLKDENTSKIKAYLSIRSGPSPGVHQSKLTAVFISSAPLPLGNLMCLLEISTILSATSRMHLTATDLDRFKLSRPVSVSPVTRNLRQTNSCRSGGKGKFLFVGRTMPMGFISLKMNIIVLSKNLYGGKTSSASKLDWSWSCRDLLATILLRRR